MTNTIRNPVTNRKVKKDGIAGLRAQIAKMKSKIANKKAGKKDKKKANTKKNKNKGKDKLTKMTFEYPAAMKSAQQMVDAGFECNKLVAICKWNKQKKLLVENAAGVPYWSSKKI